MSVLTGRCHDHRCWRGHLLFPISELESMSLASSSLRRTAFWFRPCCCLKRSEKKQDLG